MSDDIKIDFVGDANQLLQEYQKLHKAAEQHKEDLKAAKEGAKQANRENQQMAREAKTVWEQTRSPIERYNAEFAKLNRLKQTGHINQETYNRALRQERSELQSNLKAMQARETAESASAKVSGSMVTTLAAVAAGYGLATTAVNAFSRANRQAAEDADAAASKWHAAQRKFGIQSGLTGFEGQAAQDRMLKTATDRAMDFTTVTDIGTQLVSSGFSPEEASGGTLNEFLMLLNAQAAAGESSDPAADSRSLSMYLQSQGLEKNAGNVRRVGRTAHALSKAGQFNMQSLAELSTVGAPLASAMSPEEQMAAMGTLVDVMPAAEAATGLRNVVGRLRTAGESNERVEALGRIGLKPQDVDFHEEGYDSVMQRLAGGLQGARPEERAGILMKLFEEKGVGVGEVLIGQRQKTRQLRGATMSDEAFTSDVIRAESGPDKAEIRQQNELLALDRQNAMQDRLHRNEQQIQLKKAGAPPIMQDLAGKAYDAARYIGGASPGVALQVGSGFNHQSAQLIEGQVGRRQLSPLAGQQNDKAVAEWSQALKENTAATKENSQQGWRQNRGAGGAPVKPPEAGLGRTN